MHSQMRSSGIDPNTPLWVAPVSLEVGAPTTPGTANTSGDGASACLLSLYERMIGGGRLDELLAQAAHAVAQAVGSRRATLYVMHESTQELESLAMVGNVPRRIRVPIDSRSLAGHCAATGQAFIVPDAYADLGDMHADVQFDRSWDEANGFRTRDVICAPVRFKDEVIGVAQAMNAQQGTLNDASLARLVELSRLVGFALYHARLYDDVATLKRLDQEKAELMRVLVHELKSPVAGAKMLASGLRFAHRDDPKLADVLSRVTGRLDDLLGMIGDILELSRVKAAGLLSEVAVLDLAEHTASACASHFETAADRGLTTAFDAPAEALRCRFDRKGWQMVVSNLVSNAVKYTPAGSVHVELTAAERCAVLRVTDSGIGIPADELPKLFGEFFRATNARDSGVSGSGVGLAAIKQIVERFGGHIEVQSQQGHGSTFTVRLPVHHTPTRATVHQ